ncbi:uncharacterized protein LOC111393938 isoform X3 [Olea europaea var. sylvestris]|uniref:uncharacterized protein LOC111393938 isoform X3 n=1 Tax=Olea europaea var. sylvestris TaxID=158386 RepID=UPI000C1D6F9A|nr:uncharacterized protein LOC111393938 isoform X3 [Olea europaea var. sylvestris]
MAMKIPPSKLIFLSTMITLSHVAIKTSHVQGHARMPPSTLKSYKYKSRALVIMNTNSTTTPQFSVDRKMEDSIDAAKLRDEFLQVLRSRRTAEVPLSVEPAHPVRDPLYQETPKPTFSKAMESAPKKKIPNFKKLLQEENLYLITEALVSSWKKGNTMPFIFDTVWDLIKLADYLTQREDVDPSRIGITGESLGGMHAWFAAAADTRYSVVVPIIGVQGFRWAIEHDKWQARVDSIKAVFEEARIDLGKSSIDKVVVEKVWDRIAPGLASQFDSPYTIPAIAPRPLLILNGKEDPRCPIDGLELPESRARKAYENSSGLENFEVVAEPGIGHQMTPLMVKRASNWFDKFLNP